MSESACMPTDAMLDASALRAQRADDGGLTVTLGDDNYEGVKVRRAFPLESPFEFIGLFASDGSEIGVVERVGDLDTQTAEALREELGRTYFLPVITDIDNLTEAFGVLQADIETSSGSRHIEIRGYRSKIRILSSNRALIEDAEGNRYELRNYHKLPRITRKILGLGM
ncbi:MAG: DUF1854 domain-containing protein [Candidatus Latescibacterota bacterium]|nr:DUF1854 domain-containing protein [Candidatus Latescibacterota bacterium]